MLVLSRKLGESIMIGDDITITVVSLRKKYQVRIGIKAPKDVAVNRLEVWQAIQRQKEIEQEGKE